MNAMGTKLVRASIVKPGQDANRYKNSSCIILISVGQPAHEGDKFAALVNLVNKRFQSCTFAVCDTLQRHTDAITKNANADDLQSRWILEGKAWVARNQEAIDSLTIPHGIFHWDEWLFRNDFQANRAKLIEYLNSDKAYSNALASSINIFIKRFYRQHGADSVGYERIFQHCWNYLVEECSISMTMWPETLANYIVYTSDSLEIMRETYARFVENQYPELLKWVRVKLKSKIYKEQQLSADHF